MRFSTIVSVVTLVWGISPRQPSGKNIIRWLLKKRTNGSVRYCQYTSFKAEAVRTVLENQLSISEGASRLSLPEGTLGQWVTAARKGLGTPGSRTVAELESEILQLRKALNVG
ncbi:transposase [Shigella sonnei]|uniref:transposase n=1 Tax=Shigella sonnei TaxID=624 RepID=UPI00098CCB1B